MRFAKTIDRTKENKVEFATERQVSYLSDLLETIAENRIDIVVNANAILELTKAQASVFIQYARLGKIITAMVTAGVVTKLTPQKAVMRRAWEIARHNAAEFGCKVSQVHFGRCLQIAWSEQKAKCKIADVNKPVFTSQAFLFRLGRVFPSITPKDVKEENEAYFQAKTELNALDNMSSVFQFTTSF